MSLLGMLLSLPLLIQDCSEVSFGQNAAFITGQLSSSELTTLSGCIASTGVPLSLTGLCLYKYDPDEYGKDVPGLTNPEGTGHAFDQNLFVGTPDCMELASTAYHEVQHKQTAEAYLAACAQTGAAIWLLTGNCHKIQLGAIIEALPDSEPGQELAALLSGSEPCAEHYAYDKEGEMLCQLLADMQGSEDFDPESEEYTDLLARTKEALSLCNIFGGVCNTLNAACNDVAPGGPHNYPQPEDHDDPDPADNSDGNGCGPCEALPEEEEEEEEGNGGNGGNGGN